jgi:transposase-like protein
MVKERLQITTKLTLIQVLEEEIEAYIRAAPYQRTAERQDYRNGTYERDFDTSMGSIEDLSVPRTWNGYRTELFEHYQRRQAELDEAIFKMFVLGSSQQGILGGHQCSKISWWL